MVRRADNLTTFICRLSWNLGASTFWNPQGLSRPVMGLLYLLLDCVHYLTCTRSWYLLFILLLYVVLILLQLSAVRFNEDPCVQEFGISVGGRFEEVEARILVAPQLECVSKLNQPQIVDCGCFCNWIHIPWTHCKIKKFCIVHFFVWSR
jgi:hypothetical protein